MIMMIGILMTITNVNFAKNVIDDKNTSESSQLAALFELPGKTSKMLMRCDGGHRSPAEAELHQGHHHGWF